ncbi:MAG: SatD family protein [Immundisolibacter sp.]|uniref:SatD family protein n=1 Tax=Immundisolibacter sp. TaxID=1934948 RepID=UPI003EE3CB2B
MQGTHTFIVLVADLVASHRALRRPDLALRLETCLRQLASSADWRAPLMSTRGLDELSGVLRRPQMAFDLMHAVNLVVWPQRFRFALAAGTIDVGLASNVAGDMDGPAFHRAADALARVRRERLAAGFDLPGVNATQTRMAEALAGLHQTIMENWSPATAVAVAAYEQPSGQAGAQTGTQAQTAHRLGISQQAVSAALRRARVAELAVARDALRRWLHEVGQEQTA